MAKAAVEPEEVEVDYTTYLDKAPTDTQARFADWLKEKVGVAFGTKKEESAFEEGVRLGTALRMPFQRSPENQESLAERRGGIAVKPEKPAKKTVRRRAEPEEVEEEEEAPRRPAKKAAPVKRARKAAPEPEEEESEEPEETSRPARRPARRRSGKTAATAEAPF